MSTNSSFASCANSLAAWTASADIYRAMLSNQCNVGSFEERQAKLRQVQASLALKPEELPESSGFFFEEADDCGDCVFF